MAGKDDIFKGGLSAEDILREKWQRENTVKAGETLQKILLHTSSRVKENPDYFSCMCVC